MKGNMTYQKPCLRNIAGNISALCKQGSGATGIADLGKQCNEGGSPDFTGSTSLCQVGIGDINDFASACSGGTSYSAFGACNAGPGAG